MTHLQRSKTTSPYVNKSRQPKLTAKTMYFPTTQDATTPMNKHTISFPHRVYDPNLCLNYTPI